MSEFNDYVNRVEEQYRKESSFYPSSWTVSRKIMKKIGPDGTFLPFHGFTTVFRLKDEDWQKCNKLASEVIQDVGSLITILPSSTYHITLHTLWNDNNTEGGRKYVDWKMKRDFAQLKCVFDNIKERYGENIIKMRALGISSDCSDVVCIKFVPEAEEDYKLLMILFGSIEEICTLGKPYLPHISLGYFKAKEYTESELKKLFSSISEYSVGHGFTVNMAVADLVFEEHEDMSGYRIIEI